MSARSQLAATLIVASLSIALLPLGARADDALKANDPVAKPVASAPVAASKASQAESKAIGAVMARIDRGKSQLDRSHKLKTAGLRLQALKKATRKGLMAALLLAVLTIVEYFVAISVEEPLLPLLPFVAVKGWIILDAFMHVRAVFHSGEDH